MIRCPEGILLPPGRDTTFLNTLVGGLGIRSPVSNQPLGYMQQWNFNIQRQLADGTLVDVAYAGSKGTSLPVNAQTVNQLPDQHLALGTQLNEQVPNPFHGTSIATGPLSQPTVSRGQLLRPYPQFTGVSMAGPTNRSSTYHSFQAKIERRFSGGASLLASYTAGKLITDAGTLTGWLDGLEGFSAQGWATGGNNNDLRSLKSLAAFDVSQRFVLSYVLDLPFGKGKPIGGNLSGAANKNRRRMGHQRRDHGPARFSDRRGGLPQSLEFVRRIPVSEQQRDQCGALRRSADALEQVLPDGRLQSAGGVHFRQFAPRPAGCARSRHRAMGLCDLQADAARRARRTGVQGPSSSTCSTRQSSGIRAPAWGRRSSAWSAALEVSRDSCSSACECFSDDLKRKS